MALDKPSDQEDEFFIKMEKDRLNKLRAELDKKRKTDSKEKRKNTHWMKCPKCGTDLEELDYQKVMIDRCNECKGIWLDAGELELLVEGEAKVTKGLLNKLFGG